MVMTALAKDWFQVDKEGLASILKRRGVEFALFELVSNALDTQARTVSIALDPGHRLTMVTVTDDDPNGFADLAHAFTLFAPSAKKSDLAKRGRFNLGEKLVLAICDEAEIQSTTGMVSFKKEGRRVSNRAADRRLHGSLFHGKLRMTREEAARAVTSLKTLIVPPGVTFNVNGALVIPRKPVASFKAMLATEVADADGNLKRSRAVALVKVYEPRPGETPSLYEMGIPVVETGDRWHVDVGNKVPLNMDRDNVPPSFLRELRAHVLNAMADEITPEVASASWVREAAGSPLATADAVDAALTARFGTKRVAFDPSDLEANKIATASGYAVVHGGSLTGDEWESARRTETLLPAGKVTPSPKPFSPGGKPLKLLERDKWTPAIELGVEYACGLARRLLDIEIDVQVVDDKGWKFNGTFSSGLRVNLGDFGSNNGLLRVNLGSFGRDFFDGKRWLEVDRFLLHEFSHHFCSDHLSRDFAEAGFKLGARLKQLALDEPEFFRQFMLTGSVS